MSIVGTANAAFRMVWGERTVNLRGIDVMNLLTKEFALFVSALLWAPASAGRRRWERASCLRSSPLIRSCHDERPR